MDLYFNLMGHELEKSALGDWMCSEAFWVRRKVSIHRGIFLINNNRSIPNSEGNNCFALRYVSNNLVPICSVWGLSFSDMINMQYIYLVLNGHVVNLSVILSNRGPFKLGQTNLFSFNCRWKVMYLNKLWVFLQSPTRYMGHRLCFLSKSSFVTVINRWWSTQTPLKLIPGVIREVGFFSLLLLFLVTGVLWKRSKCVIWNASVWSLWSRLFAEPRCIICDVSLVLCVLHKEPLSSDRPCVFTYENVKLCHLHNYRQRTRYKTALKSLLYDCPLFFCSTYK